MLSTVRDTENLNFFREIPWLYCIAVDGFCSGPMRNDRGTSVFAPHGHDFHADSDGKMAESSNLELCNTVQYADTHASVLKEEDIVRPPSYFKKINKAIRSCTNWIQRVRIRAYCNCHTISTNSARNPLITCTESADCPEGIHMAVHRPMHGCQRITCGIHRGKS